MSLNDKEVHRLLRAGSKLALAEWFVGQYRRQEQELENLIHDLWVWYLERPSVREKLSEADPKLARRLVFKAALQQLAGNALDADTFQGKTLYSSEAVKDVLKGRSTNKYLRSVLPLALEAMQQIDDDRESKGRPRGYAEAIRRRYEDGVVPEQGAAAEKLRKAHISLTKEVNVLYLTTDVEGVGSNKVVFPNIRRSKGGHSDLTANTALVLMDVEPEIRANYLEQNSWDQIMFGQLVEPTFPVNEIGTRIRVTGHAAQILLQQPELVELYAGLAREELDL